MVSNVTVDSKIVNGSYSGGGTGASYQYYADGQIKFAQDQSPNAEPIKDRAFSYDHAGRLQEAYSGSEARNFINNTSNAANGPFRQSYSYDGFSNMVSENWRFWSRSGETNATYNSSNRNTVWSYDADGNLLGRGDGAVYGYDAAGNEISQHQETSYYDPENSGTVGLFFLNTEGHDGDGQLVHYVKKMDHNFNGGTPSNSYTEDVFNLRSTVLGGLVISEYSGSGSWRVSYVYLGGERIGTQLNNGGTAYSGWRYVDPITGDEGNAVLDPQGVDVGHEDPFPANGSGDPDLQPDGSEPFKGAARMIPIEGSAVRCVLDGITVDCGFIRGEISVQCPNNDCGPQRQADGTLGQPFQAFVDGWSGYLPRGAVYDGNGKYHMPRPDGDRGEGQLERFNHAPPQNISPDIAGIRTNLATALKDGDCSGFIKDLLSRVSSDSNPLVEGGDLLRVFDKLTGSGQGGVVRAGIGGGRMDGSFYEGNATILLQGAGALPDNSSEFRREYQLWSDSDMIIHELIHAAGLRSYSDHQLAEAVSRMVDTPPMPEMPELTANSTDEERYHAAAVASSYWNGVLREHCKGAPKPTRPGWHWGNP